MTRTLGSILAAALAALLLVIAAGCGGDDEPSATGADTTQVEAPEDMTTDGDDMDTMETDAMETDAMETQPMDTGDTMGSGAAGMSEDCRALGEVATRLSAAFSGTDTTDADEYAQFLQEFAERAPDEIRDDFRLIAESYERIAAVLGDFDADSTTAPTAEQIEELQKAIASIDQAALTQASSNISQWITENCAGG